MKLEQNVSYLNKVRFLCWSKFFRRGSLNVLCLIGTTYTVFEETAFFEKSKSDNSMASDETY